LVKAAPPLKVVEHPKNGVAAYFLERPPGVGSTRGEDTLAVPVFLVGAVFALFVVTATPGRIY
jgi:hypothetical protein